ncbi:puromycin-sensitive aminopeptidase, putative [Entamoeba invadens IP1]|uniref:puromycin-sensitive aminopeptidase, putative n=1 Tax=Entamoeba invadens IP1 TaxID=370355 RepID=UPI0002C3D7E2|nr:puromycin-sensitive aminopeptidase, putative [Entamoeba invadens IP1]ELP85006.1 puromycin-sensitive aminopeptidase, putative [Entamoeba invadens IP1]|eukprot:XP_004184352.1 puromycin-sensitive aminopeptidase, putative [Entamoeba invadens IP1]
MTEILPSNFVPKHYELYIKPVPKENKVIGKTTIDITCVEETNQLILNGVKFSNVVATVKETSESLEYSFDAEKEQIIFTSKLNFTKGEYTVVIDYEGVLSSEELCGLYQSKYKYQGEEKIICTTQFEPSAARNAFPCFDEPNYKATFDVILEVPKVENCFSNMPIKSTKEHENMKVVSFETTPKMSTYIVAFVSGEFTSYTKTGKNGVELGLHFAKNHQNITRFALDVMDDCLALYEQRFKIKYPLKKCDWIALPDFEAGAMENWGIITSRETEVCLKENASTAAKKRSASVVCHELAHMWFGDLVTMKWWNDLWLNEGFASYMGDLFGVNTLFPEWNMESSNVVESLLPAMNSDENVNTHPISGPVKKASDIEQLFDLISYEKGCGLINMMINYVGFDNFMNGISVYLKKFEYGNAESDDMWKCVGDYCGIDLKEVVQAWTYKPGFPVVSLELKDGKLYLEQERCGSQSEQIWQIPMILSCDGNEVKYMFKEKKAVIEWPHKYVIANTKSTGFYRVKYSDEMLEVLQKTKIGKVELMCVFDDLYTLGKLGVISSLHYLKFLKELEPITVETYQLSRVLVGHFYELKNVFRETKVKQFVEEQTERLLAPALEKLGMGVIKGEPFDASSLRSSCLIHLKRDDIIKKACEVVMNNEVGKLSGELVSPTCLNAGKYGDENVFNKLSEMYTNAETVEIQRIALKGMASTQNEELVKKALQFTETGVRKQDVGFVYAIMFIGESELVTEYIVSHIKEINEKYGGGMSSIRKWILEYMMERYSSKERLAFFTKFFEENKCVGAESCIKQGLEGIAKRAAWIERDLGSMLKFIE